jgi:eukaryotic-like serine/threonine-protein kinase
MRTVSFLAVFLVVLSCTKPGESFDPSKEIVSFSLKNADGTAFTGSLSAIIQDTVITVTIPNNTSRIGLIPEIGIKGKTISPASGVAQNFSVPVKYTVTAEDGSSCSYTVIVVYANPAGVVYVGSSNKNFYALDALTGNLKWNYTATNWFVYSSPTYANGTVYVGCVDSYVYAFNAVTGIVKWRFLAGNTGVESDAVVVNNVVYVGSNDDYLYALDAATGQMKWRFLTGANVSASPVVINGTVYFGSSDGKLYALDANSGGLKWSFTTGAMINQSGPAYANGILYVGSRDSYLYAIDAVTGLQKWRFYANGISLEQSSATVANGIVYIGGWYNVPGFTQKGSLYAVNANTGQLVWEKLTSTGIGSSPCVYEGKVYISCDDNNLYALDAATGATLWQQQVLANSASAAVANGIVYIGSGGTGYFYAFDAQTGVLKWKFSTPGSSMTSSPLIVNASGDAYYSGDSGLMN